MPTNEEDLAAQQVLDALQNAVARFQAVHAAHGRACCCGWCAETRPGLWFLLKLHSQLREMLPTSASSGVVSDEQRAVQPQRRHPNKPTPPARPAADLPSGPLAFNVATEKTLSAGQAASLLPSRVQGHDRTSPRTIVNWIERGKYGIRLEGVYTPGGWVTSWEALDRFLQRLAEQVENRIKAPVQRPAGPDYLAHERAHYEAEVMLWAAGIGGDPNKPEPPLWPWKDRRARGAAASWDRERAKADKCRQCGKRKRSTCRVEMEDGQNFAVCWACAEGRVVTDLQVKVWCFVAQFRSEHGHGPRGQDVADHFHGWAAYQSLDILQSKGWLARANGTYIPHTPTASPEPPLPQATGPSR